MEDNLNTSKEANEPTTLEEQPSTSNKEEENKEEPLGEEPKQEENTEIQVESPKEEQKQVETPKRKSPKKKTNLKFSSPVKKKPQFKSETPSKATGARPKIDSKRAKPFIKNTPDPMKTSSFMQRNKDFQEKRERKLKDLKIKTEEEKKQKSISQMAFKRPKSSTTAKNRYNSQKSAKDSTQPSNFFDRLAAPIERKFRERDVIKPERNYKRKKYNFNSNKAYWNQIHLPFRHFRERNPSLSLETLTLFFRTHNFTKQSTDKELVNKAFALLNKEGLTYENLFFFVATVMDATNCEADKDKSLEESYLYNNEWLFEYLDRDSVNWGFISKADKLKKDFEEFRMNWNEFDDIRAKKEEEEKNKLKTSSKSKEKTGNKGKIAFVTEKDKIKAKLFLKDPFFTEEEKANLTRNGEIDLEFLAKMEKKKFKHEQAKISQNESKQLKQIEQRAAKQGKKANLSKEFASKVRKQSFDTNEIEAAKNRPKIIPKGLTEKKIKLDFTKETFENTNKGKNTVFVSPKKKAVSSKKFTTPKMEFKSGKKPIIAS